MKRHRQGIEIDYEILHNIGKAEKSAQSGKPEGNLLVESGIITIPRVRRNVIYFGVQRAVPYYERRTHKSYRWHFAMDSLKEKHRQQICTIAGRIIGKNYDIFERHTHSKYSCL